MMVVSFKFGFGFLNWHVRYGLMYLICYMLNIAALHLSIIWCFIDNSSSNHIPSRWMWLPLSTLSLHTLIANSLHLDSCTFDPKYMNLVFPEFILRWFCDIYSLMSFKQISKKTKAFLSTCVVSGVNLLLREWSSTKLFSRIGLLHLTGSKSGPIPSILLSWWITYWSVLEYAMIRVGTTASLEDWEVKGFVWWLMTSTCT